MFSFFRKSQVRRDPLEPQHPDDDRGAFTKAFNDAFFPDNPLVQARQRQQLANGTASLTVRRAHGE